METEMEAIYWLLGFIIAGIASLFGVAFWLHGSNQREHGQMSEGIKNNTETLSRIESNLESKTQMIITHLLESKK